MPSRAFRLKAPPPPLEKTEQAALFQWRDVMKRQIPELAWLFAIPNGLWLPDAYARTAVKQGLTPGVSDVALLVPRSGYHGLLIELKRQNATPCCVNANQKTFLAFQAKQGYRAEWCKGWEAAKNLIIDYLGAAG
jgi:hypothetical protein